MWLDLLRHKDLDELVRHHYPDLFPLWEAMVEAGHEPCEAVELAELCERAPARPAADRSVGPLPSTGGQALKAPSPGRTRSEG